MIRKNKGFTLIELLVVIAIIGILSSVVLASLNSARGKGSDAAVKAAMNNLRAQAALFYDGTGNQTYSSLGPVTAGCTTAGLFSDTQTTAIVNNITGNATSITCSVSSTTFAVRAVLKGAGTGWCVDSVGAATGSAAITAGGICQ